MCFVTVFSFVWSKCTKKIKEEEKKLLKIKFQLNMQKKTYIFKVEVMLADFDLSIIKFFLRKIFKNLRKQFKIKF